MTALVPRTLTDHIYDRILAALINGEYTAGDPLNIDAMARDFNVSPTPIREALVRLESTALVNRVALKGYRVAPLLSKSQWSDFFVTRSILEPQNAFYAAENCTADFLDELTKRVDQMKETPKGISFEDFKPFWLADEAFHRLIAEQSGNEFLVRAFGSIANQTQRFRLFAGQGVTDAQAAIVEHERILSDLVRGDSKAAKLAMKEHIQNARNRVMAGMNEKGHPNI